MEGMAELNGELLTRVAGDSSYIEESSDEELTEVLAALERLKARVWSRLIQLSAQNREKEVTPYPEARPAARRQRGGSHPGCDSALALRSVRPVALHASACAPDAETFGAGTLPMA